ncbi:MAG TPA: MHYT domain-containing protein [Phenylobacterium sp.]
MIKVLTCLGAEHDLRLVLLAGLVCAFSSSLAMLLYARSSGSVRPGLLGLAGVVAGAGIWSTHFIAMLAFQPGLATGYAPAETLGSLAISVAFAVLGFNCAGRRDAARSGLAGGVIGLGVALMHYTGMAGLHTQGTLSWNPGYVAASVLLGVALAASAFVAVRSSARLRPALQGALLLTLAICGLHFTGMAAVTITPDSGVEVPGSSLSRTQLAVMAAIVTVLGLSTVAGVFVTAQSRRAALRQLREAIASTPDGMAIYDFRDRLVAWNDGFIAFLGFDDGVGYGAAREQIVRAGFARIAAVRGGDPALEAERLLAAARAPSHSQEHQSLDGRWWRAEHRLTPRGGRVSVFVDISRHKEAEQTQARLIQDLRETEARLLEAVTTAQEASRAKTDFLANMSHELRTPLNGVLGLSGALKRRVRDPESQEMISLIEDSGRTLQRVLSDILDLSKIEARKVSLETQDFDLLHEVEVAVLPFAAKAQEKGVGFHIEATDLGQLRVSGDALRIRQILSNLVSNAVKFTDQGDVTVTIQAASEDPGYLATFTVRDTGIGFDASQVERLFQAFEQDDASTTRRFGGTGLGLPICKGLAELLRGSLTAVSTPGAGSAFTLCVPLLPAALQQPAADAQEPTEVTPNLRILLAEDHVTNQRVVELLLQPFGTELVIVGNGVEAVAELERQPFDLVLMDMQMPVMDGLEATREIRRRELETGRRPAPIAMLTANVSSHFVKLSLGAGANHHIAKPVTLDTLVSGIETCLAVAAIPTPDAQQA